MKNNYNVLVVTFIIALFLLALFLYKMDSNQKTYTCKLLCLEEDYYFDGTSSEDCFCKQYNIKGEPISGITISLKNIKRR